MKTDSLSIQRPASGEYAPFYSNYVSKVPEQDILVAMQEQWREFTTLLQGVSEEQASVLHPPYMWTIKQVVNHITDGERIFAYRALRIARGDQTPLPGFDENEFARTAQSDRLKLAEHVEEFEAVRKATITLFRNIPHEAWVNTGTANDKPVSVRAIAWIIVGHARHHQAIIGKRLGKE